MDVSLPLTEEAVPSRLDAEASKVEIPQYGRRAIVALWAASALPMAALAWLIAPAIADRLSGEGNVPMAKALIVCLTVGLIWQFILVAILVGREQRTLRWSTIREALWLRSPRSPRSGRVGGRVWLILIPLIAAFAAEELISGGIPTPANRDMGSFLDSDVGRHFLSGNWGWFGLIVVLLLFNTVLGEELLRLPDALAHRRLAEPERGVRPAPRAWSSSSSRSDTPAMRSHARPHRGSAR